MHELSPQEEWARRIISATLGETVVQHDDGSKPRMYDLDILREGCPAAAVEVIAAADSKATQLWNLVNGSEERWQVDALEGAWMVVLTPLAQGNRIQPARAKVLRGELPGLLIDLEQQGRVDLDCAYSSMSDPLVQRGAQLGVVRAWRGLTDYAGSIYMTIDEFAQFSASPTGKSVDVFARWINEYLTDDARQDVLGKLCQSAAPERHVFIAIPPFSVAPEGVLRVLLSGDSPAALPSPVLPSPITHVWAVSTWKVGAGMRWSQQCGWKTVPWRPA